MQQRWSKRILDVLRANFRRGGLFLLGGLIAIMMVLTPMMTRPANAQGITDFLSLGGSFTNSLSSCAIETVGWVICPTMRSIAKLADYGFTYMNQNFLRIDYALASNDSGTYKAWEIMRNVANALFVVAFMVLVYSQLTGRSSGGYSIKRLLPRLIIAAIAVNVSYYICVLFVDVSNILGDSILAVLVGISERIGSAVMPIGAQANAFQDGTLTVITSFVMTKPGIAWVLLTPVAAVIISIATICAAGLVLLIMRKTIIAMLILVSPILFVAYLLPNLERFFTQGTRLFIQLLLLYPIIALLLGAGQIVSSTIVSVGTNDANYRVSGDAYFSRGGGSGSAITDLTAAAAAVLPLLGVWFLFKNMSSIMSTAGSRLSASIRGRRGGEDKEARVTGKATVGAARVKNAVGLNRPTGNRRQAYTRNKRRASLGGSSLTGESDNRSGFGNRQPQIPAIQNRDMLGGGADRTNKENGEEEAEKRLEEMQNAQFNGTPGELSLDNDAAAAVVAMGQDQEKEKSKTAKDIFNSMNKGHEHESKDKERKFSAGAPAAGGGGGGQSSGSNQPSAPAVSFKAPSMSQNNNIISGSSAPTGGSQQSTKIVAVPVQVDASALLGHSQQQSHDNPITPPVSGTEEKAKARAQKYLFDAENDLEEARDKQDILGDKHKDEPTEMPHVPVHHGTQDDKDKDD